MRKNDSHFGFRISDCGLENASDPSVSRRAPIRNPQSAIRNGPRAFTLLEMLVTVAVTVVLVLFLNQIFGHMSGAVSTGIALSTALENARIITPQLEADAAEMVGPGDDGVLVIINELVQNVPLTANSPPLASLPPAAKNFRADQAMWIRGRGNQEPLAPGNNNSYSNDSDADNIMVRYGHGLVTLGDGTDPISVDLGIAGPNQYSSGWALTRHAMFFDPGAAPVNAHGGWFDAEVVGYGAQSPPDLDGDAGTVNVLYNGLTDVANFSLNDDTVTYGAMVGDDSAAGLDPAGKTLWEKGTNSDSLTYRNRAYQYTFAIQRLRINPKPQDTLESWRIAQMHSFLAGNVCSFAVEFAGDYDGDAVIDRVAVNGPIRWYAHFPDPTRNVSLPPVGSNGFRLPVATTSQQPIYDDGGTGAMPLHANGAFIFRHGAGATNWPYMLRFRYRIVDGRGKLTGADGLPGKLFEQVVRVNRN